MPVTRRSSHGKVDHRAAVLCAVALSPAITYAELTEAMGFSAMTVKRSTDDLIAQNFLIREKQPTAADGRWGHRLTLHPGVRRLVLDLTTSSMVGYLFCGGAAPSTAEHRFEPTMTFEENVRRLVSRLFIAHASTAPITHGAVGVLPPSELIQAIDPLYLDAYRKVMATRGDRLWEDLAEVVHGMSGTPLTKPVTVMNRAEAVATALGYHPHTRGATVALCTENLPSPHATLFVRHTPEDAWFIPTGSAYLPVTSGVLPTSPLITPQVILTEGATAPPCLSDRSAVIGCPIPLRVQGVFCRSLKAFAEQA